MGGGTFDVSLVKIGKLKFEVLQKGGDFMLGGNDFDNAMMAECIREFKETFGIDLGSDRSAKGKLKLQCEKVKKILSDSASAEIKLKIKKKTFKKIFTRSDFEGLILERVDKALQITRQTLAAAKMSPEQVDQVLLVGGSTFIPLVRKKVQALFGSQKVNIEINPDECVSLGASIWGAICEGAGLKGFPKVIEKKLFCRNRSYNKWGK